ncbi:sugar transferase [Adlercreutzia muris]|uniref:sugar transferase n=1 Tax=Adlercreutzia muris TaxID=1796610 RepID=UPI0013665F2E|nr:sugar transferase [Adlercreutzia muris]NCA31434.1 sugar transferase [Adlercreutzia muris]
MAGECGQRTAVDAGGNRSELVSDEEDRLVSFLRERNFDRANATAEVVVPRQNLYSRYGKRVLDVSIAAVVLLVTLPFNVVFGLLTLRDVGRPVFYKQERTGRDGKPFVMVKFRNMSDKRDSEGNLLPASERVTKFGRFMRKYSLDELLNFWSVLKGDMSIIGPRPYPTFFTERMTDRHKMRHAVRPGIECPKMISLPNEAERLYNIKLENDIWYVENISFGNDLRMVGKLFSMVFNLKVRGKHAGSLSYFVGYDDDGFALGTREAREFVSQLRNEAAE